MVAPVFLAGRAFPPFCQLDVAGAGVVCAVLVGILLLLLAWRQPDRLARFLLWLPAHLLYRIRVYGLENLPARGPVLLVCNHVSWIDAILIFLAQKRLIHFMIWAPFLRVPGLRVLLRLAQVIPIDGSKGPRAIVQSLRAAGEALARGEVVCIFAEGSIT